MITKIENGIAITPKFMTGPLINGRNRSVRVKATPLPSELDSPVRKKKIEQKANAIRIEKPNLTLLLIPPLIFKIAFS